MLRAARGVIGSGKREADGVAPQGAEERRAKRRRLQDIIEKVRLRRHAERRWRRDEALAAVRRDGHALVRVGAVLKRDRDVVLAAVKQNGYALEHADDVLRLDRGVVLTAVKKTPDALMHLSLIHI